ncbi:tRNA methyltransferase-like protein, partial [Euroglyphus maynei]
MHITIWYIRCADGQYLNLHSNMLLIGMEHCEQWFQHENYNHSLVISNYLLLGDVLCQPFRDDLFDGILCCGVIHHLSTLDRRIMAIRELARILRIGGRVLITVTGHRSTPTHSQD